MPNGSRPEDTGFYVICNALDKSIWVAFDFEPYGEVESVRPEYCDPYGDLPGDKQNLVIGVQQLLSKDWMAEWPFSLDRGDPFTSDAPQPMKTRLIAKPAYGDEAVNAIKGSKEYQGWKKTASGSTAKQQIEKMLSRVDIWTL